MAAAVMGTAMMMAEPTAVPTAAYLSSNYDCTNKYVVAVYFDLNISCSAGVVWAGTYNNWNTNPENMLKGVALDGDYAGWYVFEVGDNDPSVESPDVMGKPVVLDEAGAFTWSYQPGVPSTWVNMGGDGSKTASMKDGYDGETDCTWPDKGAYIYKVTGLKQDANPCTAVYHDYTVRFYVPEFCADQKGDGFDYADSVNVRGSFDNWTDAGVFLSSDVDEDGNDYYYLDLKHMPEGTALLIRLGSTGYDDKLNDADLILGATADTTFNYSDKTWKACAVEQEYTVTLTIPAICDALSEITNVQIVGTFDGWVGTDMTLQSAGVYSWTGVASSTDKYKFRLGADWANELMYNDNGEWKSTADAPFGMDAAITLDYSDPAKYMWKGCEQETALHNIFAPKATSRKMLQNGHLFIINRGMKFNAVGRLVK